MISSEVRKANKSAWFVMKCRDAEKIEAFVDKYNADKNVLLDDKIEDMFIPALVIPKGWQKRTRRVTVCAAYCATLLSFILDLRLLTSATIIFPLNIGMLGRHV